ncbi:hypothetical protein [Streptomyces sp. NBC_00272]|uniref:hypothetical protein n=1 Tax=Streptomyces sp. NBC_00272 TaxID=2975698 RepID=UPI002E2DCD68|nr:hypothetical protein [Streptomyces sp. NBC_00272]
MIASQASDDIGCDSHDPAATLHPKWQRVPDVAGRMHDDSEADELTTEETVTTESAVPARDARPGQ